MKANRPLNYSLRNRTPSFLTSPENTETGQHSQSSTAESQQQPTLDNAAGHQETGADHPLVETEEQIHLRETNLPAEDVQVHFNEPAITEEADPQTEDRDNIPAEDTEHQNIDSRDAERTEDQQFSEQLYISDSIPSESINLTNMATIAQLSKFNGTESPCIWLSKLSAWQKFHRITDNAVLDYIPCLLEGSAGTWFQTINPGQFQNLQGFKDLLSERFKPSAHKTAMLSIKQEPNETCEQYLERAERLALAHHDLDEAYKVQFIANGLNTNLRWRVLAREPQTFQALRKDISLVQLELGYDQHVSFMTPITPFDMNELSRSINSHIEQTVSTQINALADRLQDAQHFDRHKEEERRDQYRDTSRGQHERYRDTYRGQHDRYRDDSRDRHNQYSDTSRGRYKSSYRDHSRGRDGSRRRSFEPREDFRDFSSDRSRNSNFRHNDSPRNRNRRDSTPGRHPERRRMSEGENSMCAGCGKSCQIRSSCPAFNTRCYNCKNFHHFSRICTKPNTNTKPHNKNSFKQQHNYSLQR